MALPLIPLITAMFTAAPAIMKQLKTKPKTMVKEFTTIGVGTSLYFIGMDLESCGQVIDFASFSCVTPDHWSMLITSSLALIARLNGKRKDEVSD